jgi:hypothetical protein
MPSAREVTAANISAFREKYPYTVRLVNSPHGDLIHGAESNPFSANIRSARRLSVQS